MYGTYIEKLIAEKYGKKPWHQIEEVFTKSYKIKNFVIEKTFVDLDGEMMILDEKKKLGDIIVEQKNYDWTPSGGRFVELLAKYKYNEVNTTFYRNKSNKIKYKQDFRPYPNGIWEQRALTKQQL